MLVVWLSVRSSSDLDLHADHGAGIGRVNPFFFLIALILRLTIIYAGRAATSIAAAGSSTCSSPSMR